MYYIERNPIADATFLAGSIAEPSPTETIWVTGSAITKGQERIRPALHRVFKAAADIASSTVPPEDAPTVWQDMRPTDRYRPLGPMERADKKLVYQNQPLESTSADLEYRFAMRYANAIALFGLKGAAWRVKVYDKAGAGQVLITERTGNIKAPARGYWDYAYGQRLVQDRVLINDLPIYPNAEIRITIEGGAGQTRAIGQMEVGKLRYIPGVDFGGVEYGINRSPKAFTASKVEDNGTTSVLIYGTSYDMSGTIKLSGTREDAALIQLRALTGRGAAFAPTLTTGYTQSLVFGVLKSSDASRESFNFSSVDFRIEGLPT